MAVCLSGLTCFYSPPPQIGLKCVAKTLALVLQCVQERYFFSFFFSFHEFTETVYLKCGRKCFCVLDGYCETACDNLPA